MISLFILHPAPCISSAKEAMEICLNAVIPSLFPFMVISGIMISSGACTVIGKLIHPLTKRLLKLSENGSFIFFSGFFLGYPIGAKQASYMVKNNMITLDEAQSLISFCNNSGPLFVIGTVGSIMYNDHHTGVILYVIHILSAITYGIITRNICFNKPSCMIRSLNTKNKYNLNFINSVEDAMDSVIKISAYIIFFATICTAIKTVIPAKFSMLSDMMLSLAEITSGIKTISLNNILSYETKLIFTSFLLSFSGICISLQIKSAISGTRLKLLPYIKGKICQGILSAVYTVIYLKHQYIDYEIVGRFIMSLLLILLIAAISVKVLKTLKKPSSVYAHHLFYRKSNFSKYK